MVGSVRNTERTGKRTVSKLSSVARRVEKIRAIDVDLVTYCPRCKSPQSFCEVKKYLVSDYEWEQMRLHAKHWGGGAIAILVVEPELGQIGVRVYDPAKETISTVNWGGEEYLQKVLEAARDRHECQKTP
jgi:hypothetical protein